MLELMQNSNSKIDRQLKNLIESRLFSVRDMILFARGKMHSQALEKFYDESIQL